MQRETMLAAMEESSSVWDVIVIGGGATGLSAALEAASRGHRTVLVEALDFASGTSSRSTKLIHGGVRYLRQGQISMVRQSLAERTRLLHNAPHLVHPIQFILPTYRNLVHWYYFAGLRLYDCLSGCTDFSPARRLSAEKTMALLPGVLAKGLRNGVEFSDGQFDDARLALTLARTAVNHGAVVCNYMPVISLKYDGSQVRGVVVRDSETGREISLHARTVLNATGVFADRILNMDQIPDDSRNPVLRSRNTGSRDAKGVVSPSQGTHLVLDSDFLPGRRALMIPKTDDGRVLFVIPWHGKLLLGTTDRRVDKVTAEPRASEEEIDYLLDHAGRYLQKQPTRSDIRSVFSGLRPLVRARSDSKATSKLSREHEILISPGGLISVIGGKWTTCRHMGEQLIDQAESVGKLTKRNSRTADLRLHGACDAGVSETGSVALGGVLPDNQQSTSGQDSLTVYGSDAVTIRQMIHENAELGEQLHPNLSGLKAEVIWAAKHEMARTVEDVLARRTRSLLLDASAAAAAAETVSRTLGELLGRDKQWQVSQCRQFQALSRGYLVPDNIGPQSTIVHNNVEI